MQVTPGIVLTDTEDITADKLNLLGTPVVAIEEADIQQVVDAAQTQFGNGVAGVNYLVNPALDVWTRGTSAASLNVGVRTFRADNWWARCVASTSLLPTYARAANAQQQSFLYCALLTGNTGAGALDFGQEIAARIAACLGPTITFTFGVENGTGSAVTPQVRLDTCDTLEDYGTTTNRVAQNTTGSVASGAFTAFTVTIDTSGFVAAMRNGCLLYVRFASGTMDSASKSLKVFPLKLEIGDTASINAVERDEPAAADTTPAERNFLINGTFDVDAWGSTSVTCLEDIRNFAARGWWANPSDGSTMVYARDLNSPDAQTAYCAKLTGSTATTGTVDFGQEIRAAVSTLLRQQVVFSCQIYNGTGADFVPLIRLDTPGTADDFSSVTNRENQNLQNCVNGTWTKVSFAFNGADYTNMSKGLRLYVRFPSALLITTGDVVRIAQCALELGTTPTAFNPTPVKDMAVTGHAGLASNLVVQSTSSSALSITADTLTLLSTDGSARWEQNLSLSGISIAGSGAGGLDTGSEASSTWYTIWVIHNGIAAAGLLSLSTTAPTMPAGYRWKAKVGYVRNDGSSNFISFYQVGREVLITTTSIFSAKKPSVGGNTYQLVSVIATTTLDTLVPPAARYVRGLSMSTADTEHVVAVASDSNGSGEFWMSQHASGLVVSSFYQRTPFRVALKTTQDFYWKTDSGSGGATDQRMEITGYEI